MNGLSSTTITIFGIVIVYTCVLVCLYVYKIKEIKAHSYEHSLCLPICKTIANFVKHSDEMRNVVACVEDTQFRSMSVIIFDISGEVWVDSRQVSEGKLPLPASEWQQTIFRSISKEAVLTPAGIIKPLFLNCSPKSVKHDTGFVAAVYLKEKEKIVVVFQCGNE